MQQLFRLLIFLNQPKVFRATNSPILRSTFDCIFLLKNCWKFIQTTIDNQLQTEMESYYDNLNKKKKIYIYIYIYIYIVKNCS